MMIRRGDDYAYKENEFENVDVAILKDQDGETRAVIYDHFSGEQLAEFIVIEEDE